MISPTSPAAGAGIVGALHVAAPPTPGGMRAQASTVTPGSSGSGMAATSARSRRFGSQALKVNGSIFAMVTGGRLVVKLPRDRVDTLVEEATGAPFDSGKGRPMKEWLAVTAGDDATWLALAQEALAFVGSRSGPRS